MASGKSEESQSAIVRWYEGKTIFMTGGTGFMGKVIVERLLWTCPGIKRIYVLIRNKKGEDIKQRLAKVKDGRVFENLRNKYPERLNKLDALNGDIEFPNLGLSASDLEILKDVNVVFNVAATLQFNEDLRKSMIINVLATKTMLDIAATMKDLNAFVHVSTAYSNCDRKDIDEIIYPAPTDLDQLIKDCEECSDEDIEELTIRALGNRPNTYTLTKALAENVVEENKTKFPIAIVRPSIVTPALAYPFPGWVDCKTGSTGIVAAVGSGFLRVIQGEGDYIMDIVPVDIIDDAIIIVAYKTATLGVRDPVVYNVTSGKYLPYNMSQLLKIAAEFTIQFPQDTTVWYPSAVFISNRYLYRLSSFWMQTIPAYLYDILVPSSSKKVKSMVNLQRIMGKAQTVLEYFLTHEFNFSDDNVQSLIADMSEEDRKIFNIDLKRINWRTYLMSYIQGIRRYLLGQKDTDLPKAKERMNMYSINHKAIKLLAAGFVYYVTIHVTTPYLVTAIS